MPVTNTSDGAAGHLNSRTHDTLATKGFSEIELGPRHAPIDLEATPELIYNGVPEDAELGQRSQIWTTLWAAVSRVWDFADDRLADLFGLDESKYAWAVREHHYQKRQEALRQEEQAAPTKASTTVQSGLLARVPHEGQPVLSAQADV